MTKLAMVRRDDPAGCRRQGVTASGWSTHLRLSRYSHCPGRSPLVGEATAAERDDRHCEHGEYPMHIREVSDAGRFRGSGITSFPMVMLKALWKSPTTITLRPEPCRPMMMRTQQHGDDRRQGKYPSATVGTGPGRAVCDRPRSSRRRKRAGRWKSAKNGTTIRLASKGPRLCCSVDCKKPVHPGAPATGWCVARARWRRARMW